MNRQDKGLINQTAGTVLPAYLVGIDGGGTGTRVAIARVETPGVILARADAGPSGLGLGIPQAWRAITHAVDQAFRDASLALDWAACVVGCGLAGANHLPWREAFLAARPVVWALRLEGDAYTTVLGAHAGAPGVAIALGTGSIGMRLGDDGRLHVVGGFGFPSGDEASGAWLGLRVISHLQKALDGRGPMDSLAMSLREAVGLEQKGLSADTPMGNWPESDLGAQLLTWQISANQTAYATLAPVVVRHADHPVAAALLQEAAADVVTMVDALDRDEVLPLALCGSLASVLKTYLPEATRRRVVGAKGDSVCGALQLARQLLHEAGTSS